jgi:SAM-dependent methyltransferase
MSDVWARGDAYEAYVGRWSRRVAYEFLKWLAVPAGRRWLDVGCGTGEHTRVILDRCQPTALTGVDPSRAFLALALERTPDRRAEFREGDAQALPFEDSRFDACVSGLVLNFVPKPERGVSEMARVTRGGGTVAAYVWDYAVKMEMIRYFFDAAVNLDPAAADVDEGARFPICNPEGLAALFTTAGLNEVETRAIDVPTHFRDFDDYWTPFLAGTGVAPAYAMSLSEDRRAVLRERIRQSLPVAQDGSISLVARAWAVKGTT